ncbi:hypothetical protein IEO21_09495 [Rhodonia placenta]|uniref:Phosphatidylserine decarboxylase n=1 Tax=Rhodonia placenta TaxID=104341 RepID=A0A8H7NUB6_9APHY|nr:hypothetical protein IEO21_09495 [Postia placenta]
MSHLPESEAQQRPIQDINATNLPAHSQDPGDVAQTLDNLVTHSQTHADVRHGIHAPMHRLLELPLVHKLIPGIEKLASEYHVGNFVIDRTNGERFFESMPIYTRLGMHLLFYGGEQRKVLHSKSVEAVLRDLSVRQGKIYDAHDSVKLAPADYHRFHSPIDGTVGEVRDLPGEYYTVNPQAVNEQGFDVFTANKRAVLSMTHAASGKPVAFVAIGAMLVGSIVWTAGGQPGAQVRRGDELGYFAYGGSTVVVLFPPGLVAFDDDLRKNSEVPVETLVKVGMSIGRAVV